MYTFLLFFYLFIFVLIYLLFIIGTLFVVVHVKLLLFENFFLLGHFACFFWMLTLRNGNSVNTQMWPLTVHRERRLIEVLLYHHIIKFKVSIRQNEDRTNIVNRYLSKLFFFFYVSVEYVSSGIFCVKVIILLCSQFSKNVYFDKIVFHIHTDDCIPFFDTNVNLS